MVVELIGDSSAVGRSDVRRANSPAQQRAHAVQDVFSEVLEVAGRRGYVSANAVESDEPLGERIESTWSDWFDGERDGRYAIAEKPAELKQGFGEILGRAHAEGGYVRPKEFLKELTPGELKVVQNVHWLAKTIDVDSLSEEGALNLLLPGAAQVDLNHDGLTRTGKAYGLRFPDSNTPTDVAAAWEEATADLELGERMMFELNMVLPVMLANIHLDENGAYSHTVEPGDPRFVNPMAAVGYSYVGAVEDQLDQLDFVKQMITREEYDRQTEFWGRFRDLLNSKGAR